ncbi:hypothetical protein CGRA01v4_02444 [Colletotrichum graminicola]|uniref:Uncharacterized protein n=1 Tax=Colletotrichum graminicola (strain M1.001 / M2 / FGSC 10212) TaxID=645133 RepID=E3Q3D9_COLGM|nr:uncharacterized protein GLRG_00685 [Colletotrichum graminicola M1.001]EFQ25541.1 hypothetical protein GLRG_00685 [Colletotrichum graminicola M1.001]WDK11165.1 hypothetical protein CGRA01v4_02444 [Colletotrichum graminicola]
MPYYEYDHTHYDRQPRPYNPRLSSLSPYRIEDLYAALPGDIVWSTACPLRTDRDIPPFMDPGPSDREVPPLAENRKRREKKGVGQTQTERGGGGDGSRDVTDRGKQIDKTLAITRPSPLSANPEVAIHLRERRLIEVRLLLSQLHAQLETAYNVYKTIDDKFRTQCNAVKSFVSADTLDKIWSDMVQSGMKQEEAQAERSADFDSVMAQIGLCLRHLQSAEKDRLPSVHGLHERNAIIERQFKNITKAVEEIVELGGRAHMDHLACGDLIWHLNRAWTAANPESVMWKSLLGKLPAAEKTYVAPDDNSN